MNKIYLIKDFFIFVRGNNVKITFESCKFFNDISEL